MPSLQLLDDHENCDLYCIAHVYLLPPSSKNHQLWKDINKFSKNKYHYRHDYLKRGVCLDQCSENYLPYNMTYSLEGTKTHNLRLATNNFSLTLSEQQKTKLISCVNHKLPEGFNAFVNVSFCYNPETRKSSLIPDKDLLDWCFILIFCGMILIVVFATVEHSQCKKNFITNIFSLQSSWAKFTNTKGQSITFNGIKCAALWSTVVSHSFAALSTFNLLDTFLIEDSTHRSGSVMVYSMYFYIPAVFIVISGYLCTFQLLNQEINPVKIVHMISKRMFKFLPMICLLCCFLASIYVKLNNSPIWMEIAGTERMNCRQNWFDNIIFINNIHNSQEAVSCFCSVFQEILVFFSF